jgi:drug/metabolite transporter (DMT)-like permease
MTDGAYKSNKIFLYGMVASMFCWGLSWTSGKILTSYGSPMQISFFRFLLTFISLFVILLFNKESLKIKKEGAKDLLAASILIALYTYLFFKGLLHGYAGAGGVLVTILNPLISYLIMLVMKKQLPGKRETLGLLTGIAAGCILLKIWKDWNHFFDQGNSYFLLASLSWSILSLFTSKASRYGSPVVFSLWMYGLCALMMFFLVGISGSVDLFQRSDLRFWGNLFFSATITTALATTFYFVATSRIGAGKASSFIFMVPLSAALGSLLFLGEVPQPHTIAGGILGIAAVYIINSRSRP